MASVEEISLALDILCNSANVVNVQAVGKKKKELSLIYWVYDTERLIVQKRSAQVNVAEKKVISHKIINSCPECKIAEYGIAAKKI